MRVARQAGRDHATVPGLSADRGRSAGLQTKADQKAVPDDADDQRVDGLLSEHTGEYKLRRQGVQRAVESEMYKRHNEQSELLGRGVRLTGDPCENQVLIREISMQRTRVARKVITVD